MNVNSLEALKEIARIYGETNSLEGTYDLFLKIKQALERLEVLEKENQELKETIEIRKEMNINLIDFGTKLKQENEKLKKALSIIRNKCYSLQLTEATDEEFNLIKEVLGE